MVNSRTTVFQEKIVQVKYPKAKVIALDDSFNTFEHVVNCLMTIIPGMSKKKAWELNTKFDMKGSAEVWRGNLEQAEPYNDQLSSKALTIAPIDKT